MNSMKAIVQIMNKIDEDETAALLESSKDILDTLEDNPEVFKTISPIIKELSGEEGISEGFSNLAALAGPAISSLNNTMTPELVDGLHELAQEDEMKEAIGSFLSAIDPEMLGTLLPELGNFLGEILSDISEDEEAKKHLKEVVLHGGALTEKVTYLFSRALGPANYISPVGGFDEEDFPILDETEE